MLQLQLVVEYRRKIPPSTRSRFVLAIPAYPRLPSTLSPSRFCKTLEGYAAVRDGKMIVGVSFLDMHAAPGSKVAGLGPTSSLAPGAGKKTLVAACDHAENSGSRRR